MAKSYPYGLTEEQLRYIKDEEYVLVIRNIL
jgi:hypothetical protein